jgi:hypothetical protein
MQREQFANQQELRDYADAHEGMSAFAKRWRLAQLAQPGTYELVEVRTKRGVTKALLFPNAASASACERSARPSGVQRSGLRPNAPAVRREAEEDWGLRR